MSDANDIQERALLERLSDASELLKQTFLRQYRRYRGGDDGLWDWSEIGPPESDDLIDVSLIDRLACEEQGRAELAKLVVIKLNGGLGTTMDLSHAKSLVPVRDGRSFLQLVVEQIGAVRQRYACDLPLLLMNSYRTRDDCLPVVQTLIQPGGLPHDFLQHKVPRIDTATAGPLSTGDPSEWWAPPGHGDIYLALFAGGLLRRLVDHGYRWAFVSNVDNLAATVDPALLGLLAQRQVEFAMEVTDKTAADIKGGTLVRYRGRLNLLERAQVAPQHIADFQDISKLRVFNTNSLWWRLDALLERLERGALDLPLIVNPKRVAGCEVVQLETAMGAAIGSFPRAAGLRVPRSRFAPVKGTEDLLVVRSDAYQLDEAVGLRPSDPAAPLPVVRLDARYYRGLADLEMRVPHSLGMAGCRSLTIEGDVRFGKNVVLSGDVSLRGGDQHAPLHIADGTRLG